MDNTFQWEKNLEDIRNGYFQGPTTINVFNAIKASTGVTRTGTIVDLSPYSSYMFYIDSSSVTTVAAGMTGLEVEFYLRPNSGASWGRIALQSGIAAENFSAMKIEGTGGVTSGVLPIRDLKILVTNRSGSATATLNGWVVAK